MNTRGVSVGGGRPKVVRTRAASLAMLLALLFQLVAQAAPAAASVVPPVEGPATTADALGATPWVASGSPSTVVSDGSNNLARLDYNIPGPTPTGSWTFLTTAAATGQLNLHWEYVGFHGFCGAAINLHAVVQGTTPSDQVLAQATDSLCNYGFPSGGFDLRGIVKLNVTAGEPFGFTLTGTNGDIRELAASLIATPVLVVAPTPPASGGGTCAAPDFNAIQAAVDASVPNTTIHVCAATYNLAASIAVSSPLSFEGDAAATTILGGGDDTQLLSAPGQSIAVRDLTFSHGHSGTFGGAISAGNVSVANSVFTGNSAVNSGGAIGAGLSPLSGGNVTVTNSTFTGNSTFITGTGGAIRAYGAGVGTGLITATRSTFTGNSAGWAGAIAGDTGNVVTDSTFDSNSVSGTGGAGGAINGPATVTTSTFVNNTAINGGAILAPGSRDVTVVNSTFSGNSATTSGGAIEAGQLVTVSSSTFVNNAAPIGAAIRTYGGVGVGSTIRNSILAAASGTTNCNAPLTDSGGNFSTDGCIGTTASLASLNLGPLHNNGGLTQTIALLTGSVAIDAGVGTGCPVLDQVGTLRSSYAPCDSGAFEYTGIVVDAPQAGPDFVVNTSADLDDGVCSTLDCTLREAIIAHNAQDSSFRHAITFAIPGAGRHSITIVDPLPAITVPVDLDGQTQAGSSCASPQAGLPGLTIAIVGPGTGSGIGGLDLSHEASFAGSRIHGLAISAFGGNGLTVEGNGGSDDLEVWCNQVDGNAGAGIALSFLNGGLIGNRPDGNDVPNAITNNGSYGIDLNWTGEFAQGNGVRMDANYISGNDGQGIRLAPGAGGNDALDTDTGTNGLMNTPVLFRAEAGAGPSAGISGRISTEAGVKQDVTLYLSDTCDSDSPTEGGQILATLVAPTAAPFGGVGPTDANGNANFTLNLTGLPAGKYVTATATGLLGESDPYGATSEFSDCILIGAGNDSWPNALDITGADGAVSGAISYSGQARWYKVAITPGEQINAQLANLPGDYDILLFSDIGQAYAAMQAASLTQNTAEASGGSSTGKFSGGSTTGRFSGGSTTGRFSGGSTTGRFSAGGTGTKFSGDLGFSADAFSGGGTGTKFSGGGTGTKFSPDAVSGGGTGTKFSPDAYSGAQVSSLVAFNEMVGTASKSVSANTWTNTGFYYIRVAGKPGEFNPNQTFDLTSGSSGNSCGSLLDYSGTALPHPAGTNLKTVILTDLSRMVGSSADKAALTNQLTTFAARSEVGGVVVDLGASGSRINQLNAQADAANKAACPYAKNLVALAAKEVVDSYRSSSPNLQYVVLVGGDKVIPFFRYPDTAELAPETLFYPPVDPLTASEASLRLSYVLSQDAYGAGAKVSLGVAAFPVPSLAVGRLVETASEASGMLDAYLSYTAAGVVSTPTSSLATGYDFMADAATSVAGSFASGIGTGVGKVNDTLINETWTASDLSAKLLGSQRHDLVFLAGHFSANRALAADQNTTVSALDLVASQTDFQNTIVFSQGCHSGYGIVDSDGIANITQPLDWAQAFARKRATLIAGTGFQYGDTELIEYSEAIYDNFATELRMGSGPVAVGKALIAAKQDYLRQTPDLGGTDTKALLQSTLYGLPMLSVNLPAGRIAPPADTTTVPSTAPIVSGPGRPVASGGLGLQTAPVDLTGIAAGLQSHTATPPSTATWFSGHDGTAAQPYQPVLPLILRNVSRPDLVLRGVGFVGGEYTDTPGVTPLVSVPATEQGSTQTGFSSPTFYPVGIARVSYFDALGSGATRLLITPVQHRADGTGTATLRKFDGLHLQLFYSSFNGPVTIGGQTFRPAQAAAPSITDVQAIDDGGTIDFAAHVSGDPSAGIQKVWITYTGFDLSWQSLADLTRDPLDPTRFTGSLTVPSGHTAAEIRFLVQAASGTGLVSMDTNGGAFYSITPAVITPTTLSFDTTSGTINPANGTFGSSVTFAATLSGGGPIAGQPIVFSLGGNALTGITDAGGHASVTWPLVQDPGGYDRAASFGGNGAYGPSVASSAPFTLTKANTSLTLTLGAQTPTDSGIIATLKDGSNNVPLAERTVFLAITGPGGSQTKAVITRADGSVTAGKLPPGTTSVKAYFLGVVPLVSTAANPLSDVAYNASDSGVPQAFAPTGPAPLTIAFTAASKAYDGNTTAAITGCSLIGAVGSLNVACSTTGATATFASATAGTFKAVTGSGFTLTGTDAGKFTFNTTAYTTADILARTPQTITFVQPSQKAMGTSFNPGATASSGLAVTYTASPVTVCTVAGSSVTLVSLGTCTVTASQAGNGTYAVATPVARSFLVVWPFGGFQQPVDSLPTVNQANAGQAIPVKFSLGGNRGLNIFQAGFPKVVANACPGSTATVDAIEQYASSNAGLTYDAGSNSYTYVWKTDKKLAGGCYQLQLGLVDGNTTAVAEFKFK